MERGKIAVVGNTPLVTGFYLCGILDVFPVVQENFEKTLEGLIKKGEFAIVIVNEKMMEQTHWKFRKMIENVPKPVIISVPDVTGACETAESVRALVKRALGFDLFKK